MESSELAKLVAQELRKVGLPFLDREPECDAGGIVLGAEFDDTPHVSVAWVVSGDLQDEAKQSMESLLSPSEDHRPVQERLDELFSSSSRHGYRDQVRRIMATAIHEILLSGGFDARVRLDDTHPGTTVDVFDRAEPSKTCGSL
ncbi:hypothetical protein OHB12_11820 [Nocardia sp. NBC_01730]|uniref:hypothetical protein n=1 Tax=Nocardia sp. NBC_01730 TaxID=2975998 RepID=UPI002E0FFA5A|nr:hypothetical protein OHB12_11820 [Nocardia sp. NBC_01730]